MCPSEPHSRADNVSHVHHRRSGRATLCNVRNIAWYSWMVATPWVWLCDYSHHTNLFLAVCIKEKRPPIASMP